MNEQDVIESIRSLDPLDDQDARVDADRAITTAKRRGRGTIAAAVAGVVVIAAGGSVFALTRPAAQSLPSFTPTSQTLHSIKPTPNTLSTPGRGGFGLECEVVPPRLFFQRAVGDDTPLNDLPVLAHGTVGHPVHVTATAAPFGGSPGTWAMAAAVTKPGSQDSTDLGDGRNEKTGLPASDIIQLGPIVHRLSAKQQAYGFWFTANQRGRYPVYTVTKAGQASYSYCRQSGTTNLETLPWQNSLRFGVIVID